MIEMTPICRYVRNNSRVGLVNRVTLDMDNHTID